jgi:diguanylate cyclase (GGDEF)-like protein/PAS domain S-box-containing protein
MGPERRRAWRETVAIALVTVFATGLAIPARYHWSVASMRADQSRMLRDLAQSAAAQLDSTALETLRSLAQVDETNYQRALQPLQALREANPRIRNAYAVVLDGQHVRQIVDGAATVDRSSATAPNVNASDVHDLEPMLRVALGNEHHAGHAVATTEPRATGLGTVMTAWAPILSRDARQIGAIGIDVDAGVFAFRLNDARSDAFQWLLGAALRIALLCMAYYWFRQRTLVATYTAQSAVQTLTLERERLRSVLEGTRVGTWEVDVRTGDVIVNERMASIIGYRHEELLPITMESWWKQIHPDDKAGIRSLIAACMDHAEPVFEGDFRVRHKDGHWVWIASRGNVIELDEHKLPLRMVGIHVDISSRKALEQELAAAARRDRLTGLANRTLMMERMQLTIERISSGKQKTFALLFLDFDRFKLINDTMGHAAGDELLRQISGRLAQYMNSAEMQGSGSCENLVARFGGDEFLILINDLRNCSDAKSIANGLLNVLATAFVVNGREVHSTASIGIVTSNHGADDAEAVIRNADVAMYEAKRSGRSCAVIYTEAMRTRLTRHVAIDNGLRTALGTAQFTLVYQPIVELETGCVVSMEALARWTHPTLGRISPSEFIPIAEESDLIVSIGSWVLNEACRQLAHWRREYPERAPATVSVNISRAELALGSALLTRIRTALDSAGLPARCLQLEVTEREVMFDPDASLAVMRRLREIGVRLAMDDFGTGTSSLGCLRHYPFDVIKIDRAFLSDLGSNANVLAVIHATITLIENLGVVSVAEGVENADEVAILQSLGCRHAQGYFFSQPLAPHEFMTDSVSRPNPMLQGLAYES